MLTPTGCRERQQRLRQALAEQRIDAAIISDPLEIYYFSGLLLPTMASPLRGCLWIDAFTTWMIAPMNTSATVDDLLYYEALHNSTTNADWTRRMSQLAAAKLGGGRVRRIGWQSETLPRLLGETVQAAVAPDEWIAVDDLIGAMQQRKDPDEIAIIRRSIEIDLATYRAVEPLIQPGVREIDILAAAQQAALQEAGEALWHGGDYACGVGGGWARDRRIEAGELYVVDAWTYQHGYWADLSRTYIVGDAISPLQQSIFDHMKQIHEHVPELLKPGVDGIEVWQKVDALVREHPALAASGLTHHAGHNLGLRAHEMPDLNPDRGGILQVGNVVTLEPGAYMKEARQGVRLENMYLITETGVENLSVYPMSLR
ncbi:MAG: Xaa-Pro peptidase family protein [Chloroflexota bacterium]